MKKHEQKSLDLNKGLILIQTLQTYRTISRKILNKLNELENLFNELISVSDNPTLCIVNTSNLHLEIAIRIYEIARSLRQNTEFIQSQDSNKTNLIYITLQSMSAAHLTQTNKIPESDNNLLTCANILNKAAYYYLTKDDQNMAEILLKKAGCLISNIKNTTSEEYRATTAKTTAAMDFFCPKITSDEILTKLKDKNLRTLAKLYSECTFVDINLTHIFHDSFSCINMLEKIEHKTKEDNSIIAETKTHIVNSLIRQINTDIYILMRNCKSLAESMPNILIWCLSLAEEKFMENKNSKHELIIIQLLKSYCFMKLNNHTNAAQSFAFVQENRNLIIKRFSNAKRQKCQEHSNIFSIFVSISHEIKNFLSLENPKQIPTTQISATRTEEKTPPPTKRKKRTRKKKNKSNPEGSNPNRFFQPLPESPAVEENSKHIPATQTGKENLSSTSEASDCSSHPRNEPYSDEDIIKLLQHYIKTKRVKIEPVIPFDELTNKLTKELLTIKDRKCSTLIPINCGYHHAFLYMKQNSENPEFFYFDLQESVSKNICDKIAELFPNSKIEHVITPNLEATKKIPKQYNSFLKTIVAHKKYDSLLIYFIECYISHCGELLFERRKEDLSAFADLEYNANQEYLSGISDNTPSMNNTS